MKLHSLLAVFSFSALASASSVWSQTTASFPSKPVTLIVAFAPGGGTDVAARLVAQDLATELGQPVIVENRAGAGGMIGAATVARAAADGYTLLFGSGSELTVLPAMKKQPGFDTQKQFMPVTQVGTVSFMLVASPAIAANNVGELVVLARANPGQVSFASYGVGSTNHLIGELFSARTNTRLLHVPYKGSAAASTDLMAGQVQIAFDTVSVMLPQVRAGKLKALGVLSARRSSQAPELPTMSEAGVSDLVVDGWLGILAPAGTPPPVVERLNQAIAKVLAQPKVVDVLHQRGVRVTAAGPAQFRVAIERDLDKWRGVVQAANIPLE